MNVQRSRNCCALLVFVLCTSVSAAQAQSEPSPIEEHFSILHRVENSTFDSSGDKEVVSDKDRAQIIRRSYDKLFSTEQGTEYLRKVKDKDLELLYRAATLVEFYTFDQNYARDMLPILDELQARGLASAKYKSDMYRALISSRMLPEAKDFAVEHSALGLEVLPKFREAIDLQEGGPTEWVMSPNQNELVRRSVNLNNQTQIIVVSHPSCHFSQDAIRDIEADPVLHEIFKHHARWIAPQSGSLNLEVFKEWNSKHHDTPMTLAYKQAEWPFDSWGTPTFYFMKDGVLAATVTGWPKEGRKEELLGAMNKVGLVSPRHVPAPD